MRFTSAELRAAHDALHRLIAHGEHGESNYTDDDARAAYDKVSAEVRKRDRRAPRRINTGDVPRNARKESGHG